MFLSEMRLEEPGHDRLIRADYELPHLETYFTVGPKEACAWTITTGTLAPQAASVIHGDFEKGFIRAETIAYADYVALGGEGPAKGAGKMRAEGKGYFVQDGDVMHFLFNTRRWNSEARLFGGLLRRSLRAVLVRKLCPGFMPGRPSVACRTR